MIRTILLEVVAHDMSNQYWIDNAVNDWLAKNPNVEIINISLAAVADQSGYLRREHALVTYRIPNNQ